MPSDSQRSGRETEHATQSVQVRRWDAPTAQAPHAAICPGYVREDERGGPIHDRDAAKRSSALHESDGGHPGARNRGIRDSRQSEVEPSPATIVC